MPRPRRTATANAPPKQATIHRLHVRIDGRLTCISIDQVLYEHLERTLPEGIKTWLQNEVAHLQEHPEALTQRSLSRHFQIRALETLIARAYERGRQDALQEIAQKTNPRHARRAGVV